MAQLRLQTLDDSMKMTQRGLIPWSPARFQGHLHSQALEQPVLKLQRQLVGFDSTAANLKSLRTGNSRRRSGSTRQPVQHDPPRAARMELAGDTGAPASSNNLPIIILAMRVCTCSSTIGQGMKLAAKHREA